MLKHVIDPSRGLGSELTFTDPEAAKRHVDRHSGAVVVYLDADAGDTPTEDILPGGNFLHLMSREVQLQVRELAARMYRELAANELASARSTYDAVFSLIPGKMGHMLDSYTTDWHLWIQKQPVVNRLMRALYGPDFRWLHNRASIRLGLGKTGRPEPHRNALKSLKKQKAVNYKWHKEGRPGEYGYICCLPLQGGVARRSFAFVGDEHTNPFPQPTGAKLFDCITPEQIAARGLTSSELDVFVPEDKIAIIFWDHNMVHGIHPGGVGVQLYLSAADPSKIGWLHRKRKEMLKRGTCVKMHDAVMRCPDLYYDTVQLGWLYGCNDQLWPSGKPIPSHSVHGQSVGSNRSKFPNSDFTFHLRQDGTVPNGPETRRRLVALGIEVPEIAYHIPHPWVRDPSDLDPEQLHRWGFK